MYYAYVLYLSRAGLKLAKPIWVNNKFYRWLEPLEGEEPMEESGQRKIYDSVSQIWKYINIHWPHTVRLNQVKTRG